MSEIILLGYQAHGTTINFHRELLSSISHEYRDQAVEKEDHQVPNKR